MADEEMLAMANGKDDDDCQAGGLGLSRDEALKRYGVHVVLAALPHLTGDELRRVAEAMPRVAGEWVRYDDDNWGRRIEGWSVAFVSGTHGEDYAAVRDAVGAVDLPGRSLRNGPLFDTAAGAR